MNAPLFLTRDDDLLDELLRLAAAAGVTPEVAGDGRTALASWTSALDDCAHHLVVTRQASTPLPAKIRERLDRRVTLTRLDVRPGSLLRRAARLRSLARCGGRAWPGLRPSVRHADA